MIRWENFNESDNQLVITREMVHEVIFFRLFTNFRTKEYWTTTLYIKFEKISLILSEIGNISNSGAIESEDVDKIYNLIKGNIKEDILYKLRDTFIELYTLISKELEGFPYFYEIEDSLFSYSDNGCDVEYEFRDKNFNKFNIRDPHKKDSYNPQMFIMIKNHMDINEYSKLIQNSSQIISRLKLFTKKKVIVSGSEYAYQAESYLSILIE